MAALTPQPTSTNPFRTLPSHTSPKEEWEDWDVDSENDDALIDLSGDASEDRTRKSSHKSTGNRLAQHRSIHLPRVKSRARQRAQNAKANIKVVTDMSQFQKARTVVAAPRNVNTTKKNRFADPTALQALEGKPSSSSVGSFAWLHRKGESTLNTPTDHHSSDLSPDERPIVIGISVPSDDVGSHQVSPQTAVIETPMGMRSFSRNASGKASTPQQLRSVWSPDTEVSESPYSTRRPVSSAYSQYTVFDASRTAPDAPPVPELPVVMNSKQIERTQDQDDEDSGTPYTPFEEDDTPTTTNKSQKLKAVTASPGSASSRSHGWWDHVMTPFTPQASNPFKSIPEQAGSSSASAGQEWWSGVDEKKGPSSGPSHLTVTANPETSGARGLDAITPAPTHEPHGQTRSEKAHTLPEESQPSDAPPPYEYPKANTDAKFAVSRSYMNQPIPSPGPLTPGLAATMSSQRGINLAEIPLTPVPAAVLPNRPVGSYRTGDHFYDAPGRANKVERQRRRHEKEDVVARKVGGFWRGRGCVPEEGCFGRSGREGRKRRRVCLGIFGGIIAAIILIVVLVVVLTRRAMSPTTSVDAPPGAHTPVPTPTYWLNLTDFPPMPTGVLTVAGSNNSVAVSDCFVQETPEEPKTPSTAWSCALPKEAHDSVAPYEPNQPEFIFQVQFDNSTRALWKLADKAKDPGHGHSSFVTDDAFDPKPAPPTLEEIRFLGNTTDDIKSPRKEGEPTPFFISLLESIDKTVGPNTLTRRQDNAIGVPPGSGSGAPNLSDILPAPELNPDGTGAPGRLFPTTLQQQPVRLFDRGMPTEHYGFYTYFDKRIYMKNITARDAADEDGGAAIENATQIVTFGQIRFLVKIWTQLDNAARLLGDDPSANHTAQPAVAPGSMPYPVTVVTDMHGGDQGSNTNYAYGVRDDGAVDRSIASGILVDRGFGGTLVNGDGDETVVGGINGGTGGCKCQWVNFED